MTNAPSQVPGAQLGIPFPPTIERLLESGPEFLTRAFRAAGAIRDDNRVTRIVAAREFFGGGAGRKLSLDVEYAQAEPGLHTSLFVKYPRDFGDPLRELFSHLMEPETRFALLSRQADFPVVVPRCYFADYDPATRSGMLVTERIAFGSGNIEPFRDKCLDYELDQPLAHYRALLRVVARLAGAHRAGRFGEAIDRHFPYDPANLRGDDRIPYDAGQLDEKLRILESFARRFPQLIPPELATPGFLAEFRATAQRFLAHELSIKRYLNADRDMVALCHWNANVDNAWFWRTTDGVLEAGLLDWGSVGQMNVAQSIFGSLCAVELPFWDAHKADLIGGFARDFQQFGGARLDVDELTMQVDLFTALLGLAWLIDAPSIISAQLPDLESIRDRHDPRFRSNFLARAQLQLLLVLLNAWKGGDFGSVLDRFLRKV